MNTQIISHLGKLYKRPVRATRSGSLFSAFPYPTKISPEAVALFIATHSNPGDTIFDGFGGSGTTGLATLLCSSPPGALLEEARRLNLPAKWGPRKAVVYELGALGTFIGETLCSPPDPKEFAKAARQVLTDCEAAYGWMYAAKDPSGKQGTIRHAVWTDLLVCPYCGKELALWSACVKLDPANIEASFKCPKCDNDCSLSTIEHAKIEVYDPLLHSNFVQRKRKLAWIYGETGKRRWARPVGSSDNALVKRVYEQPIPASAPIVPMRWGDLHRNGYHQGITHVHHFYGRRNLIALGALWARTAKYSEPIRSALKFWILTYNASHSTLMTRVVAKQNQRDLVVTSAQSGVLYISGLPVEKNVFSGLKRKLKTVDKAFTATRNLEGSVVVRQRSCTDIELPDQSIDYVFTDPPFGGNIPYSEVNFINEAWLGNFTNPTDEVIISNAQKKTVDNYQALMTKSFMELSRIIKKGGQLTVVFHSAEASVWNALRKSYEAAGLSVEMSSILDKKQGSFKQVTAGTVRGDPLLLLTKKQQEAAKSTVDIWQITMELLNKARELKDPS